MKEIRTDRSLWVPAVLPWDANPATGQDKTDGQRFYLWAEFLLSDVTQIKSLKGIKY